MEKTANFDLWFVIVTTERTNSVGWKTRSYIRVWFHTLEDAFDYFLHTDYKLRCTDEMENISRRQHEVYSVSRPTKDLMIKHNTKRSFKVVDVEDYQAIWI